MDSSGNPTVRRIHRIINDEMSSPRLKELTLVRVISSNCSFGCISGVVEGTDIGVTLCLVHHRRQRLLGGWPRVGDLVGAAHLWASVYEARTLILQEELVQNLLLQQAASAALGQCLPHDIVVRTTKCRPARLGASRRVKRSVCNVCPAHSRILLIGSRDCRMDTLAFADHWSESTHEATALPTSIRAELPLASRFVHSPPHLVHLLFMKELTAPPMRSRSVPRCTLRWCSSTCGESTSLCDAGALRHPVLHERACPPRRVFSPLADDDAPVTSCLHGRPHLQYTYCVWCREHLLRVPTLDIPANSRPSMRCSRCVSVLRVGLRE